MIFKIKDILFIYGAIFTLFNLPTRTLQGTLTAREIKRCNKLNKKLNLTNWEKRQYNLSREY